MQLSVKDRFDPAREGMRAIQNTSDLIVHRAANTGGIDVARCIVFDADATNANIRIGYLPTAAADINGQAVGISMLLNLSEPTPGDDPLYPAQTMFPVVRKGRIWVVAQDTISAPGPVHVRHTVGDSGEEIGTFRGAADAAETAVLPSAQWITTTTADGQLAVIEINLP